MGRHRALLTAHATMGLRALRQDRLSQMAVGLMVLGIGYTVTALRAWTPDDARLWLLVGGALAAVALLAALDCAQAGLRDDEVAQLLPLPLRPATRFRLLVQAIAQRQVAPLVLSLALGLLVALGSAALPWAALLVAGSLIVATLAAVAVLALARGGLQALAGIGLGTALVALVGMAVARLAPSPGALALGLAAGAALLLGPLAGALGRLQVAAMVAGQGASRAREARRLPVLAPLAGWLSGWRSVAGALLVRDLLARQRSPLMWLRVALLPLYAALVVALRDRFLPPDLSPTLLVVGTAGALLLLVALDSAPSPLGGEGERLALLLAAPISDGALLRGLWWAILWPALAVVVALGLSMALMLGLPTTASVIVLAALALFAGALAALLAWGSAWDADLAAPAGGAMQNFLLEEAPTTLARLLLGAAGAVLLALLLALLATRPPGTALALSAAITAALGTLLFAGARRRLAALRRG